MDATMQLADTREADVIALRRRITELELALRECAYIAGNTSSQADNLTLSPEVLRDRMQAIVSIAEKAVAPKIKKRPPLALVPLLHPAAFAEIDEPAENS